MRLPFYFFILAVVALYCHGETTIDSNIDILPKEATETSTNLHQEQESAEVPQGDIAVSLREEDASGHLSATEDVPIASTEREVERSFLMAMSEEGPAPSLGESAQVADTAGAKRSKLIVPGMIVTVRGTRKGNGYCGGTRAPGGAKTQQSLCAESQLPEEFLVLDAGNNGNLIALISGGAPYLGLSHLLVNNSSNLRQCCLRCFL